MFAAGDAFDDPDVDGTRLGGGAKSLRRGNAGGVGGATCAGVACFAAVEPRIDENMFFADDTSTSPPNFCYRRNKERGSSEISKLVRRDLAAHCARGKKGADEEVCWGKTLTLVCTSFVCSGAGSSLDELGFRLGGGRGKPGIWSPPFCFSAAAAAATLPTELPISAVAA